MMRSVDKNTGSEAEVSAISTVYDIANKYRGTSLDVALKSTKRQ